MTRSSALCCLSLLVWAFACAPAKGPAAGTQSPEGSAVEAPQGEPAVRWADATLAPQPLLASEELEPIYRACGAADAALAAVAEQLGNAQLSGTPLRDAAVTLALRAAGSPYLWPQVWSLSGASEPSAEVARRVEGWVRKSNEGEGRCGVAVVSDSEGTSVVTVVRVVAALELAALPAVVRTGQWLALDARLLFGTKPEVFLQGPTGRARALIASEQGGRLKAKFVLSSPGTWTLQILGTTATGPRPLGEVVLFADTEPPSALEWPPAPGESAALPGPVELSLFAMLSDVRKEEKLRRLNWVPALASVAQAHAEAMLERQQVGHDVGLGDPAARTKQRGIDYLALGENVAFALSPTRAHRALWSSPSHRFTMLHPAFDSVGIGAVTDAEGNVWVCQLFAELGAGKLPR